VDLCGAERSKSTSSRGELFALGWSHVRVLEALAGSRPAAQIYSRHQCGWQYVAHSSGAACHAMPEHGRPPGQLCSWPCAPAEQALIMHMRTAGVAEDGEAEEEGCRLPAAQVCGEGRVGGEQRFSV